MKKSLTRRDFCSLAGALGLWSLAGGWRPREARAATSGPRYLFAFTAFGGASLIDSFLPVRESASRNGTTLTTFADSLIEQPSGSDILCVKPLIEEARSQPQLRTTPFGITQSQFLRNHGADTAVMTLECSSVSHGTAQSRALNGGGSVNRSRNLLESVAAQHGTQMSLPIVNMASGGFTSPGKDLAYPAELQQIAIQDSFSFALGTHGFDALLRPVDAPLIERARQARATAEQASAFVAQHGETQTVQTYRRLRSRAAAVESSQLLRKLMLRDLPGFPVSDDVRRLQGYLPSLAEDVLEAEAALAFLLVLNKASCAVAIGSNNAVTREILQGKVQSVVYPQNGYDNSHQAHRVAQSLCWSRSLRVADGLIRLLKDTEDPHTPGTSMWSHSLVYFATDFGREKIRPAGALAFGTGHHLNNGVVMCSPLLRGGRVYGGVDPDTCLTYGFDRSSGEPQPGSTMDEQDVYSVICEAMGVSYQGQRSVRCMVR